MNSSTQPDNTLLVADTYLGNLHEKPELATETDRAKLIAVRISRQDCCKGRISTTTETGQSVGIVKGRNWSLKDGDVMATQSHQRIVVQIQQQQVIAIRFDPSAHNHSVHLVHLGHVLGNHHWPITVENDTLYVELVTNAEVVTSTITQNVERLNIKGISVSIETRSPNQFISFEQAQSSHRNVHAHTHHH